MPLHTSGEHTHSHPHTPERPGAFASDNVSGWMGELTQRGEGRTTAMFLIEQVGKTGAIDLQTPLVTPKKPPTHIGEKS